MSNENTLKTSDNDSTKSSGSTGFDILRDLLEKPSPLIVFIICNIIFNIDTFILVFGSNNVFKKVDMLRLKYDILVVEWYYKIFFSFLIAFIHPICQRLLRYFIKRCLVLIDKRLKYDLNVPISIFICAVALPH